MDGNSGAPAPRPPDFAFIMQITGTGAGGVGNSQAGTWAKCNFAAFRGPAMKNLFGGLSSNLKGTAGEGGTGDPAARLPLTSPGGRRERGERARRATRGSLELPRLSEKGL